MIILNKRDSLKLKEILPSIAHRYNHSANSLNNYNNAFSHSVKIIVSSHNPGNMNHSNTLKTYFPNCQYGYYFS
jgi:hypothetical protein